MKTQKEQKELNQIYFAYLLGCVDLSGYDVNPQDNKERLTEVLNHFRGEYCYPENLKRYGNYQEVMRQWLMGLPTCLNVDFENYRIIELAKQWGVLSADCTAKQEDKIINNWFNFMSAKFFQLCKNHGINYMKVLTEKQPA